MSLPAPTSVTANGVRLSVVDTGGDGPVVAFSHGLLWSKEMFGPQMEALQDRFRCIGWDHRCQGRSEVTPGRVATIEENTRDALALLDVLGLDAVHFVGLSMGGFVGMRLAARHPDRIRSLALLDTAADPEPVSNHGKYRRLNFVARWFGMNRFLADRVMPIMFSPDFLSDPAKAEVKAAWRERLMKNDKSIYKAVNGVIEREGVVDELPAISCPTVVLWGVGDKAIAEERAVRTTEGIAGATLVRIPRAGHTSTIENPEAVNAALLQFYDGIDALETR